MFDECATRTAQTARMEARDSMRRPQRKTGRRFFNAPFIFLSRFSFLRLFFLFTLINCGIALYYNRQSDILYAVIWKENRFKRQSKGEKNEKSGNRPCLCGKRGVGVCADKRQFGQSAE
jgi:hypothetical protein